MQSERWVNMRRKRLGKKEKAMVVMSGASAELERSGTAALT
jgi:hypothetical protein